MNFLSTLPFDVGGATGARVVGKHLYVAGARALSIYDISDPKSPALSSTTPIGAAFPNEDVDTNGKILLMADQQVRGMLHVWDVSNKKSPSELATLSGVRDHTFTCVLRCRWAYGAAGSIIDLRDPTAPVRAGTWGSVAPGRGFDVSEVAPGLILTATQPMHFLDARKNPAAPKVLALTGTSDNRILHSSRWPRAAKDKFFMVQGETPFSGPCSEQSGAFMTWDASRWRKTHSFKMIDQFRFRNGSYTDGSPPINATGCTVMWFQEHPSFHNGGLVAAAAFDHGARFLKVSGKGRISEVEWFLPYAGSYIATYWVTDRIVYAIDLTRGIDILEFTGRIK